MSGRVTSLFSTAVTVNDRNVCHSLNGIAARNRFHAGRVSRVNLCACLASNFDVVWIEINVSNDVLRVADDDE